MNSSFHSDLENLQVAWDSTSLGLLKECPRKYQYSIILGRVPRDESVHLTFGAHYHKALEIYDHKRSEGASHEDAQRAAVRYCLEATVVRLASGSWRPWLSDLPEKNRFTLTRSVIWYLEQFKDDPLETIQLDNGKPAVELSFSFETDIQIPGTHQNFILCGHIDRLVSFTSHVWVLDRKTSKYTISIDTFKKYNPDNQMSFYDFSAPIVWGTDVKGIILDAAQVVVNFSRFQRGQIKKTKGQKLEFYKDTALWLKQAAWYAEADYYPMNDKSCGNYGGCPYREICNKSPEVREAWLKGLTMKRVWDPLQARGDV